MWIYEDEGLSQMIWRSHTRSYAWPAPPRIDQSALEKRIKTVRKTSQRTQSSWTDACHWLIKSQVWASVRRSVPWHWVEMQAPLTFLFICAFAFWNMWEETSLFPQNFYLWVQIMNRIKFPLHAFSLSQREGVRYFSDSNIEFIIVISEKKALCWVKVWRIILMWIISET